MEITYNSLFIGYFMCNQWMNRYNPGVIRGVMSARMKGFWQHCPPAPFYSRAGEESKKQLSFLAFSTLPSTWRLTPKCQFIHDRGRQAPTLVWRA